MRRERVLTLGYQPSFQLVGSDGTTLVQVGPQVFIYSRRGTYPGWDEVLWPELESAINHLFEVAPNLEITRLGLRYVNALRSDLHGINGLKDLDLNLSVAGDDVKDNLTVSYAKDAGTQFETMTRVTTVDLAEGQIPEHTRVVVDIDVYTTSELKTNGADAVKQWAIEAHIREKRSFFSILGTEATNRLRADK